MVALLQICGSSVTVAYQERVNVMFILIEQRFYELKVSLRQRCLDRLETDRLLLLQRNCSWCKNGVLPVVLVANIRIVFLFLHVCIMLIIMLIIILGWCRCNSNGSTIRSNSRVVDMRCVCWKRFKVIVLNEGYAFNWCVGKRLWQRRNLWCLWYFYATPHQTTTPLNFITSSAQHSWAAAAAAAASLSASAHS